MNIIFLNKKKNQSRGKTIELVFHTGPSVFQGICFKEATTFSFPSLLEEKEKDAMALEYN